MRGQPPLSIVHRHGPHTITVGLARAPRRSEPGTFPPAAELDVSRRWLACRAAGGGLPCRMASTETLPATPSNPAGPSGAAPRGTAPPEFPGCKPVHLPRAEIERFEGRLEYWEAATETAWICEPTTSYHERPARLLTRLAEVIARVRGSHIECYGSMDLLLRDEHGEPQRIMQADESLYLHPAHARLPGAAMVVGADDLPDVVLEVDHTTDARRGKLALYESWGFPEVWVDVPDAPSPSRPRARRPGLTIHLLAHGHYRVAAESRAFPGWTAAEIHEALNEAEPSARTSAVLERVGGVLGAREGTGPDDDPLLRSQRRQGFERGRAEGLVAGVQKARAEMIRQILVSRGIEVSAWFLADAAFATAPEDVLISAALACEDEAAFRTAISRSGR